MTTAGFGCHKTKWFNGNPNMRNQKDFIEISSSACEAISKLLLLQDVLDKELLAAAPNRFVQPPPLPRRLPPPPL